jgi:hypothetical protein
MTTRVFTLVVFFYIGQFVLYRKKRFARNAHLAVMKFVATQHRSGAKESQATLFYCICLCKMLK